MFAHLHCHSNYSLLRGACRPDELAAAAKARGMGALAVTDTNGLYGAVPFYRACRAHGIKPILGTEIVCEPGPGGRRESAVLLARNRGGYAELCRIITARHLSKDFDLAAAIRGASGGVIALTDDRDLITRLQRSGPSGARVYFELRPAETPAQARDRDEAARWAEGRGIPLAAANDVHFVNPHQHRLHQVLRAIDENTSVESLAPEEFAGAECWLKPPDRLRQEMGRWGVAMDNASQIAEECKVELELGAIRFPKFDLPPGERSAAEYLRKAAYHGAEEKYGTLASVVRHRLDYELDTIIEMGYADYFLIVWDIVEEAKRRRVPIVGRGSAADSMVSYVLDITRVDPIEYDLYFERFLNRQRKDPPDIDLDFCWRRRDEIIQYVFQKYGEERVAMISTHNTFGARSAIRDVARALGLSPEEIAKIASHLPHGSVQNIEQAVATLPEYRNLPIHEEPLKSIIEIASAIDGFPRHLSIHAGGLVIAPDLLTNYVPLQYATKGVIITQYDMHPIEDMGLVKMDLLGQRSLSAIADTVGAVQERTGVSIDVEDIPLDDGPARQLFRTGSTMGCFQVESPGMRQLLQKLGADNFEIIVAASSVIRPGPADSGMMASFIRRHRGEEPVSYVHPKLEPLLNETYGVMLYQEDILKVANVIAGMSLGEADNLRRSMSKKRGYEGIAAEKERFLSGAKKNGLPDAAAHEIWRQVESFSGYAFCKAHSASYARISWQAAYLKAHYPAEFLAAVLSNGGGFYAASAYVEEARRMGLKILPPSINRAAETFTAENGAIRVGLMQVKSLAVKAMRAIIDERNARPFDSISDFLNRVPISLKECQNLIECGAMDDLRGNRPQKLWRLHMLYDRTRRKKERAGELFAAPAGEEPAVAVDIPDYTFVEKLGHEQKVLDFCVTAHPMAPYRERYEPGEWLPVDQAAGHIGESVTVAGVPITSKGTTTSKNEQMRFVSLEDHTGVLEIVFFPDVYRRFARFLGSVPLVVRGSLSKDEGAVTMAAETVGSE